MRTGQRFGLVVVDDEPPARELLLGYAQRRSDVTVLGEAEDGPAALQVIRSTAPDIVLLDVQMPGLDGFDVAAQLDDLPEPPRLIFTTAYDRHAVRAFEVNAVDYLLKPIAEARFNKAVDRCLQPSAPRASARTAARRRRAPCATTAADS